MRFADCFSGKNILITGHTGIKGTWLTCWLRELGANITGFSDREYYLFSQVGLKDKIVNYTGDIRSIEELRNCFDVSRPEIVIHLAAQSIVSNGYQDPHKTMETNIMGTVNLLECCREFQPRSLLVVTSDKVYLPAQVAKNERDRLGGYCPYSSSKSAVEMVVLGYKNLLLKTTVATARAGNILAAGDRGRDRLLVDIIQAWQENQTIQLRSPQAIRPWQHVLDCLSGYLLLIEKLSIGEGEGAWNFAPTESFSVQELVNIVQSFSWLNISFASAENHISETQILRIDSTKSKQALGWKPHYSFRDALEAVLMDELQLRKLKNPDEKHQIMISRIAQFSRIDK